MNSTYIRPLRLHCRKEQVSWTGGERRVVRPIVQQVRSAGSAPPPRTGSPAPGVGSLANGRMSRPTRDER